MSSRFQTLMPASCSVARARRWLAAALVLVTGGVAAADGRFEVIRAELRRDVGGWFVDARVDLELSDEALDALSSGIPLRIEFQYEVTRPRRFWSNQLVVARQQDFELQYLSLSQRYVVRDVTAGTVNSYATLFSALRYLGQVRDFRLLDADFGDELKGYAFAMRAVLDWEKLPGPLAVLAFWRGDFSLESDWYRWAQN